MTLDENVRAVADRLRDALKYVNLRYVEADHGSDVADAIRSAEALLAAIDAQHPAYVAPRLPQPDEGEGAE